MKSINIYLNERFGDHFSPSHTTSSSYKFINGSDNMWNYYQSRKKDDFIEEDLPKMTKLSIDDPIIDDDFIDDMKKVLELNPKIDDYDKYNWLPLAYLLDHDYGIKLMNVTTNNGGYGHKGANSKPYKLIIQYALQDNPRKKMTIEDNSIDWGYQAINSKGNNFKEDNEYQFYGVKDAKEYATKILKLVQVIFNKYYKFK